MRKADYALLAETIKNRREALYAEDTTESDAEFCGLANLAIEFASKAHVNKKEFLAACGIEITQ